MAFSLIDDAGGAVPLVAVGKAGLAAWRDAAPPRERDWAAATGFAGEAGKLAFLPDGEGRLGRVLVGVAEGEAAMWAFAGLSETLPPGRYRIETPPEGGDATRLALGWALGTYAFARYRDLKREPGGAELAWPEGADRGLAERLAGAVFLARDLINTPASDMGPEELADAATSVAEKSGAYHRTLAGDALLADNYPTIHAVGRASARAPRLVDIVWGDEAAPKVTLVGKGVCFDTGGLDLKQPSGMLNMKKDMGGAAIMLGLAQAIMDAGLPVRLRVLLPMVENSVSGNALRPRDIVRTRKGLTVEIGNTDAEGRLILCDALAEASQEKPAVIVDAATLTGAARVAVGPELAALFCNDDAFAAGLAAAGAAEDDPMWRMPLWRPYRRLLDSKIADLNNVSEGPHAGAITAALYLQEFVDPGIPWAHLDVMAWNNRARPGRPEGAEAQAVRALYTHLAARFA
ncbi:MAG TPA: leucyl aminopeptidase family protein [Stellaceae bacterium]|nr:leucyl aminopeptidase family protein [Stellaceae bacterium]